MSDEIIRSTVSHLEHGPDVLQVCGAEEGGLSVADGLHQSFSGLCHLLHLHVVQQTTLLLTGYTWVEGKRNVERVRGIKDMLRVDDTV